MIIGKGIKDKEQKQHIKRKNKKKRVDAVKKAITLVIIMLLCTLISMAFFQATVLHSNIVMIYLLGILSFSYLAEGYLYSLFSSVCGVLLYNFFFIEPFYTFKVNNPDYFITFFVMFIIGFITSMLTLSIKRERKHVEEREKFISSLYLIEKKLLNISSVEELAKVSAEEISEQLSADVLVQFFDSKGDILCGYRKGSDVFDGKIDQAACLEAYQSGSSCGHGTTLFADAKAYYIPIISQEGMLGVIGVSLPGNEILSPEQRSFVEVVTPQISVVMEREKITGKQQKAQIEVQKERLRSDMLRSISHDFRTPLAGIMGLASTALSNSDKINDETKKSFFQSIYDDAEWLNELVENILQATRFEEGKVKLNMGEEAAEEIISDAINHVKKLVNRHNIYFKMPEEIILIKVDGILIRQVIINLINNAINYTPEGSDITVSLYREADKVAFEVKDNGAGIMQDELEHAFERYYISNTKIKNKKGMGLGLSLCKSIVEAHNGTISIRNNIPHGTIVSFYIPEEKE